MLSAKVALVSGAACGIGLAIAEAFAGAGARVLLSDLQPEAVQAAAANPRPSGPQAQALAQAADVARPADGQRLVDEAVRLWGRLDVALTSPAATPASAAIWRPPPIKRSKAGYT